MTTPVTTAGWSRGAGRPALARIFLIPVGSASCERQLSHQADGSWPIMGDLELKYERREVRWEGNRINMLSRSCLSQHVNRKQNFFFFFFKATF